MTIDGRPHTGFDATSVSLPYAAMPIEAHVQVQLGGAVAVAEPVRPHESGRSTDVTRRPENTARDRGDLLDLSALESQLARIRRFHEAMAAHGLEDTYEAAHARLALGCAAACTKRLGLLTEGKITRLPEASQIAADRSYVTCTARVCEGLAKGLEGYQRSNEPRAKTISELWQRSASDHDEQPFTGRGV